MNRPEVIILSLILLGWLIGMGYCHNATCPDCQTVAAAVPPGGSDAALAININDNELNFLAETNDNLLFSQNACEYVTPLSDRLQSVFQNTVQHLTDNANRILVLTGLYEGTETNSCTDESDLGIARAEQVRSLLVQMGAPIEQIELEASDTRDLEEHQNMIVGGIDYLFKEKMEEVSEEVALRTDKIVLYFDTNKKEINLSTEQRDYLDRLMAYLAQNADAKAYVTGHTDDRGNDRGNIRLSRKRSEFVRDFMIKQGIAKKQIKNEGKGPDMPIASNETEEGRALNRRVEITLN